MRISQHAIQSSVGILRNQIRYIISILNHYILMINFIRDVLFIFCIKIPKRLTIYFVKKIRILTTTTAYYTILTALKTIYKSGVDPNKFDLGAPLVKKLPNRKESLFHNIYIGERRPTAPSNCACQLDNFLDIFLNIILYKCLTFIPTLPFPAYIHVISFLQ